MNKSPVLLGIRNTLVRVTGDPSILANGFLLLLATVNIARTLRHAMWRDELQIFMLASASSSLSDLFPKLKYEAHPGLWHALVWLLTRVTSDPTWMQVTHVAFALAAWLIIYRWSPFARTEKFLILLSYYLFWEYFVISRSYVLLALIGFGFVALRQHRPRQRMVPWLLLGLLANVHAYGAIWSIAFAASLALEADRRDPTELVGAAIYFALLGLAIATMIPAPDYAPWAADVRFDLARLNQVLVVPLGAFIPFNLESIKGAAAHLASPSSAVEIRFWNANPASDLSAVVPVATVHPLKLAVVLALPLATCRLITRDRYRLLEFFLVYAGVLLFVDIWNFPGSSRHHGVLFLALIAAIWSTRAGRAPGRSSWLFAGVLAINAAAGVLTLASELRPFSQSCNAATWIKANNLADAFLIGSRDAQVSAVAGYLGRPLYYLESEGIGTFIVWNRSRQSPLAAVDFVHRLAKAVERADQRDAILIGNRPVTAEDLTAKDLTASAPRLSVELLHAFTGAYTDENYWIYRVSKS